MSSPSVPRRSFSRGDRSGSMSGTRHGLQSLTMSSGEPQQGSHIVGSPTRTSQGRRSTGGTSMRRPSIGFDRLGSMSCVFPYTASRFTSLSHLYATFSILQYGPHAKRSVLLLASFLLFLLFPLCWREKLFSYYFLSKLAWGERSELTLSCAFLFVFSLVSFPSNQKLAVISRSSLLALATSSELSIDLSISCLLNCVVA